MRPPAVTISLEGGSEGLSAGDVSSGTRTLLFFRFLLAVF
jgi:hypothetical protein